MYHAHVICSSAPRGFYKAKLEKIDGIPRSANRALDVITDVLRCDPFELLDRFLLYFALRNGRIAQENRDRFEETIVIFGA